MLELCPGEHHDEIHIEIAPLPSGLENMESIEALSYVWGDPADPVTILVGAEKDTLHVTRNLASALVHLRYLGRSRMLWVDAVCINQGDGNERTRQVAMMGDIFRHAKTVLVWLGEEREDSSFALQLFEKLGLEFELDWNRNNYKRRPGQYISDEEWQRDLRNYRGWWSIYRLYKRPWFERLWVRQEVGVAKTVVVMCGHYTTPWEMFRVGVVMVSICWDNYRRLEAPAMECRRMKILRQRQKLVKRICCKSSFSIDLRNLRNEVLDVQCSDPRDRLYGNLSLLSTFEQALQIVPRYDISTEEVYKNVTVQHIRYTGILDLLIGCELRPSQALNLPCWVPDWSVGSEQFPMFPWGASTWLTTSLRFQEDQGILWTHRAHIATVESVHPWDEDARSFGDWVRSVWRCIVPTPHEKECHHCDDLARHLCLALCCGRFRTSYYPEHNAYPEFGRSVVNLRGVLDEDGDDVQVRKGRADQSQSDNDWARYLVEVASWCHHRCILVTDQGGVALGPQSAQSGDHLSVLLGCDHNILLRGSASGFQVVGAAYVPGAAAGEALLGDLPEHLRVVQHHDPVRKGWVRAFLNEVTHEVSDYDPRLTRLGIDLSKYEEECKVGPPHQIRVDIETLLKAGVAVESIKLI